MKKLILVSMVITAIFGVLFVPNYTFAATQGEPCTCADGTQGVVTVDTSILSGCDCSGGDNGGAIKEILNTVVDIMTVGVGILGVIGISVVGIQYLTAGGSEEKTRKAKQRLLEIVIGLAVYAVFFAILKWLNVAPSA